MASSRMVEILNSVKSHIPTQSGSSTESKIEIEGATHLSNRSTVTEEKIVPKGKNIDDINVNRAVNRRTGTGKISRTPKTCSIPVLDSSSVFCNSSGSSASKMSHLVVQRPPSILRKSRTDFNLPALKNDKVQILSQGLSSSGIGARPNNIEARGQMFSTNLMVAPAMEKVENSPAKDPLQSVRCSSDNYKSNSSCPPSKKQMIQKSSIHPGTVVNSGFPAFADRACSNSFWKKMECYFTSVTSQDESYLKHQLDFADALSGNFYQIPGYENDDSDDLELQQHPIYSGGRHSNSSPADQELIGTKKTPVEAASLHQRLISAIIEDDESKKMSLHGEGRNAFQCASDDSHSASFNDINCEAKGVADRISENDIGSVEDKLRVQLQRLDLCPEMDAINKDIIELEGGLVEQAKKKQKYIRNIYDSVQQGKHAEKRKLEQAAMSKLIEMAYKKQRVSRMSDSSKTVLHRVSKQVALPFAERTLAKCREFEDTGRSCFREGALQNIVFSTPTFNSVPNSVGKPKSSGSWDKQRNVGMNRDFLPSDVCSDSSRAIPGGSAKRKRSEKAKNQTIKNIFNRFVPPIVHPPVGSSADARESILKPEVKASNLLASGAEPGSRYMEPTHAASDSPRMQDQDCQGLDIPMDNLSDVHFLSWF